MYLEIYNKVNVGLQLILHRIDSRIKPLTKQETQTKNLNKLLQNKETSTEVIRTTKDPTQLFKSDVNKSINSCTDRISKEILKTFIK